VIAIVILRFCLYRERLKTKLTFDSINLDFFYRYVSFLKTLKGRDGNSFSHNSKAMDIKNIKVFMAEAVDLKYTKTWSLSIRNLVCLRLMLTLLPLKKGNYRLVQF